MTVLPGVHRPAAHELVRARQTASERPGVPAQPAHRSQRQGRGGFTA